MSLIQGWTEKRSKTAREKVLNDVLKSKALKSDAVEWFVALVVNVASAGK